jgi:hypothetical protein
VIGAKTEGCHINLKDYRMFKLANIVFVTVLLVSFFETAYAGTVGPVEIEAVYQLDTPTAFDFIISRQNTCGSYFYRVESPNEEIAARKMSLVTVAFTAGKRIEFHEESCIGNNRMKVVWIKLVN